jgi:hypothetical protein
MRELWQDVGQVVIAVGALLLFGWMCVPSNGASADGELIDPDDARQVGVIVGLSGGRIGDAMVLKFALERFEKQHGRKATTRDVGVLVGLMR